MLLIHRIREQARSHKVIIRLPKTFIQCCSKLFIVNLFIVQLFIRGCSLLFINEPIFPFIKRKNKADQ